MGGYPLKILIDAYFGAKIENGNSNCEIHSPNAKALFNMHLAGTKQGRNVKISEI